MDALILSCGTGGGHNSAGKALEHELAMRGHRVKTLNPYTLRSTRTAAKVNFVYNKIAQRVPTVFGVAYHIGNAYRRLPGHSPVYLVNGKMRSYLGRYLAENHFDVIITTHLFPAEMLTNMKHHGYQIPKLIFVATDYICTPFTEETECDCYVIPSKELLPDFVKRGIPKERLFPLGIPVHNQFYQKMDRTEARKVLGLDLTKKYILIAGGSIGAGQIEQVVSLLLEHYDRQEAELVVVCGNNQALYKKLDKTYGENCTVLGHTNCMAQYMRACDLFISKPGGLSSTEAAVTESALIHITPIPGCETYNMRFFEEHGMCVAVSSIKRPMLSICDQLMEGTPKEQMNACQRQNIPQNATSDICDLIEEEIKKSQMLQA